MEITGPLTANLRPANKLYVAKLELGKKKKKTLNYIKKCLYTIAVTFLNLLNDYKLIQDFNEKYVTDLVIQIIDTITYKIGKTLTY